MAVESLPSVGVPSTAGGRATGFELEPALPCALGWGIEVLVQGNQGASPSVRGSWDVQEP